MSRNIKPIMRIVCFLLIGLCAAPLIPSCFAEEPVENKSPVRGEAAWAIYDVLRKKADSIQAVRCEVVEGNWEVNAGSITPDQTKHSPENAAGATSRNLIVWQKGVFARYEAGKITLFVGQMDSIRITQPMINTTRWVRDFTQENNWVLDGTWTERAP